MLIDDFSLESFRKEGFRCSKKDIMETCICPGRKSLQTQKLDCGNWRVWKYSESKYKAKLFSHQLSREKYRSCFLLALPVCLFFLTLDKAIDVLVAPFFTQKGIINISLQLRVLLSANSVWYRRLVASCELSVQLY